MIYSLGTNENSNFYEIWQQHKQLKIMEMNDTSLDNYIEGYILQFQPELTHKIH